MEKGHYDAFIFEAENEREFYSLLLRIKKKWGGISAGIIQGHGEEGKITLGAGGEGATLDLSDYKELEKLKEVFVGRPLILLNACSTGKDNDTIGALMSRAWNARLSAPRIPVTIDDYLLNRQGELVGAEYYDESNVFIGGKAEARK
jgi:hypothetical protein